MNHPFVSIALKSPTHPRSIRTRLTRPSATFITMEPSLLLGGASQRSGSESPGGPQVTPKSSKSAPFLQGKQWLMTWKNWHFSGTSNFKILGVLQISRKAKMTIFRQGCGTETQKFRMEPYELENLQQENLLAELICQEVWVVKRSNSSTNPIPVKIILAPNGLRDVNRKITVKSPINGWFSIAMLDDTRGSSATLDQYAVRPSPRTDSGVSWEDLGWVVQSFILITLWQ